MQSAINYYIKLAYKGSKSLRANNIVGVSMGLILKTFALPILGH